MEKYVEICGTPIEVKSIKDYRIIKTEYIYRPVFREEPSSNKFFTDSFVFERMEPYAAIIEEKTLGKLKQKVKKFECINAAGRKMIISLDEVPTLLHMADGHTAEIYNDNPNYSALNMDMTANIEIIEALVIQAKEKYTFYGNNIHLYSVLDAYGRVKDAINSLNQKKTKQDKKDNSNDTTHQEDNDLKEKTEKVGVGDYAKNIFGKVKEAVGGGIEPIENKNDMDESHNAGDKTGDEIRDLKMKLANGEISVEEFNQEIKRIIDNL